MPEQTEKIMTTCQEMLTQRGYEYKIDASDETIIHGSHPTKGEILVLTAVIQKVNTQRVKELIATLNEAKCYHAIIVYDDSTPKGIALIKQVAQLPEKIEIETFQYKELLFNLTKSNLVPPHSLVPAERAAEIRQNYSLAFPTLLATDPVARFYNFQPGDLIQITRPGGYITFREVPK